MSILLTEHEQERLIQVARDSVIHGLETGEPGTCCLSDCPDSFRRNAACFVTLYYRRRLRGCIGTIQERRPLVQDVSLNAYKAAFQDPRFEPMKQSELNHLKFQISVLGGRQPVLYVDELDLLDQINPGWGIELTFGEQRGLLLPAVWKKIGDKRQFWRVLKEKAGLPPDFWSDEFTVTRFRAVSFGEVPDV